MTDFSLSISLLMDVPLRIYNATRLMARDAVSKNRQNRETEMRKARGIVNQGCLIVACTSRGLRATKLGTLRVTRRIPGRAYRSLNIEKGRIEHAT